MTEIFLFIFGTIGMCHIIVDSNIFEPCRNFIKNKEQYTLFKILYKIVICYTCCGLYCGILCGWLVMPDITWFQLFVAGCAGSFLSNFAALYMNYLEAQALVTLHNNDVDTKE
jgi:hypothetical protein